MVSFWSIYINHIFSYLRNLTIVPSLSFEYRKYRRDRTDPTQRDAVLY